MMPPTEVDVAVIGAGPAGLVAARELAARGLEVLVLEEDSVVGRPEKCAGLYSVEGLRLANIPIDRVFLQNVIRGAVFNSPSGRGFLIDAGRDIAVVTNRERFDQFISLQAVREGAGLLVGHRVSSVSLTDGFAKLKTLSGEFSARYLIDAEGRSASLARAINPTYSLNGWIPIIQFQVAGHGMDRQLVYLYFKRYLPEFFGYLVPIDDELGKVGVASSRDIRSLASKFLEEEFPKARILGISSSSIYTGAPLPQPRVGNVYFVGDVAGHVKATTGGGVVFGGLCARAAALDILSGQKILPRLIKPLYRELRLTHATRLAAAAMPPKLLDRLFKAVSDSGFNQQIAKVGDMDRHGLTAAKLLASTASLRLAATLLRSYLF